jgi:hypothetical protein
MSQEDGKDGSSEQKDFWGFRSGSLNLFSGAGLPVLLAFL